MTYSNMILRLQLLFLLLTGLGAELSAQNDVVIMLDNKTVTHNVNQVSHILYTYSRTTEIKRKIQINSQWALEKFSELYVPTYEDLNFTFSLAQFDAKTIKKNGDIIYIDADKVKETTLPANAPFLYGYKGKVRQVAFQDLEIGDIIEYSYTTRLVSSGGSSEFSAINTTFIGSEYPTLKGEYKLVTAGKLLEHKTFAFNTDPISIVRNENQTTVRFENLDGYENEPFSNRYDYQPYLVAQIFDKKETVNYIKWDDLIKDQLIKRPEKKSYFFGGLSLIEVAKEANTKTTVMAKMRSVKDQMQKAYEEEVGRIISVYRQYQPDLYDASQVLKIMDLLDIEGGVLFVNKKSDGGLIKEIADTDQLHDFLVQFKDESGKIHYWNMFGVFSQLDKISYEYYGIEALKITQSKGKRLLDFVTVKPPLIPTKKIQQYNFNFVQDDNELIAKIKNKVDYSGQYALLDELEYKIENLDSTYDFYSSDIRRSLNRAYKNVNIVTFDLLPNEGEQVYQVTFDYSMPVYNPDFLTFSIQDLLKENYKVDWSEREDRVSNADLYFPYTKSYELNITPPAGYRIISNESFKDKFSNDAGEFVVNANIDNKSLRLTFNLDLQKYHYTKDEWSTYVDLMTVMDEFMNEKIIMIRE